MNKRVIAAVAAGALALLGVLVLVVWANGAQDRAYAGAERKTVLRVTETIGSGTSAADLTGSVEKTKLPVDAIPKGAVTDLSKLAGLATTTSLQPGEVLLKARFSAPGVKGKGGGSDVPAGYQEIAVQVDTQHGVGGAIKAGDRVGVIATFEPKDGDKPQFTDYALQYVLVTKVQAGIGDSENVTSSMVTLAVKTLDAERIVHTVQWGKAYLTLQNSATDRSGAKVITAKDVVE
ncbi:Flp pilus assembly protein CpaB [Aeromicrobium terrae]|uniref:Flp pilus assembly protein CpaB n=1 Tax=Aeromicrobium terrae TaxID=2498846 RepID=A0A5C8NLH8_9ACTN|nr:Flp pilus assembly protein CpaB [Aeromicrobium terrae]TXL62122.1 Flp pilus assembly protein CpaB [Aeromicrobium terrae]